MMTKKGNTVPRDLASAISKYKTLRYIFSKMRSSCQDGYVHSVLGAKKPETRVNRVHRAIKEIRAYGKRHNLVLARAK